MNDLEFRDKLRASLLRLEQWVEGHRYKGYEPFDGLSSVLGRLTFHKPLLERIVVQLVRQSPVNLRPVLGVKPQESTKGRGYMAWGYTEMFKITRDPGYRRKVLECLEWLDKNKAPGFSTHSWGNHFPMTGREEGCARTSRSSSGRASSARPTWTRMSYSANLAIWTSRRASAGGSSTCPGKRQSAAPV